MIIKEKAANECVHLFFGYQASSCPRPCKSTETKSKLVSKMSLNNKDEMRIRIKFKPTVTVTTTDFVKPSLGVFMSEVKLAFVSIHNSLVRNNYQSQVNFCLIVLMSGWWRDGTLAWDWYCPGIFQACQLCLFTMNFYAKLFYCRRCNSSSTSFTQH